LRASVRSTSARSAILPILSGHIDKRRQAAAGCALKSATPKQPNPQAAAVGPIMPDGRYLFDAETGLTTRAFAEFKTAEEGGKERSSTRGSDPSRRGSSSTLGPAVAKP
jgi:hypothetical protein